MARFKIKRRGAALPTPSGSRRPSAGAYVPDSNLFPMPPSPTESTTGAIQSILGDRIFDSTEEAQLQVGAMIKSGVLDRVLNEPASDPAARARQLGTQALRAKTVGEANDLAAQALALDPECVDALLAQISFAEKESTAKYQEVAAIARRLAGDEQPGENRPYLRALQHLASSAFWISDFDAAAAALEEMLEKSERDPLAGRDLLLTIYIRRRDREAARRLAARFPLAESAAWNWGLMIAESIWGTERSRLTALADAMRVNEEMPERIFDMGKQIRPHHRCWPGSPEEADNAALLLWRATGDDATEALGWLAGRIKAEAERGGKHVHGPDCGHDHHH